MIGPHVAETIVGESIVESPNTANLRTDIMDFRGFDSCII